MAVIVFRTCVTAGTKPEEATDRHRHETCTWVEENGGIVDIANVTSGRHEVNHIAPPVIAAVRGVVGVDPYFMLTNNQR